MKYIIISIINFTKKCLLCQWKGLRLPKEGFLLLELLYAMIIGLMLYGIGIHWQQAICSLTQEAKQGFRALDVVHEAFERMIVDPSWSLKKEYSADEITLSWQFEAVFFEDVKSQLPPVIFPKTFKLVSMDVTWPGVTKKRSAKLISGIMLHA